MPCFPAQLSLLGGLSLNSGSRPCSKIPLTEVPTCSKLSCHDFSSPVPVLCHLSTGGSRTQSLQAPLPALFWTRGSPGVPSSPRLCDPDVLCRHSPAWHHLPVSVWHLVVSEGGGRKAESDSRRAEGEVPGSMLCILDVKIAPAFVLPPHGVLAGS